MSGPRAQSVAEYSVCVALVIAALLGMQVLVRTTLAGKYKNMVDYTTRQASSYTQYRPYYIQDSYRVVQSKSTDEDIQGGGWLSRDLNEDKIKVNGTIIRNVE